MFYAGWRTSPLKYELVNRLSEELGVSHTMAAVLARRGLAQPEAAREFLFEEGRLHDPFLFPSMGDVCARLRAAATQKETVCIHGDYDVDGVTATALLVETMRGLGSAARAHLPNRFSEGYGVSSAAIERMAADGVSLLVTVDCGITALAEVELARRLGMDIIVIDHHRPGEGGLPDALIVSPLVCDYPFKHLAGVGLAFKVAQALAGNEASAPAGLTPELTGLLDLVALGTIADVVPLVGENRALVKRGLVQMARTRRPGLRSLMSVTRTDPLRVTAGQVAFRLAPRINAAGRLEDPAPALELLMTGDAAEGERLASELDSLNQERQKIENRILAESHAMVSVWPAEVAGARGYVLSSAGWHEGVIGIVASRMVEQYGRPVIMISESDTHGKGSGRGIRGFDLHAALTGLSPLLAAFGGHSAACGLTIENGSIEEFRTAFARHADAHIAEEDLAAFHQVDAVVSGRELTLELADELARLEPFGMGNPSVDLLAGGVRITGARKTRDGQHFQCAVESSGARASAVGFRQADLADRVGERPTWDAVFRLEKNEYNGSVAPQLNL
ncbi:MAG: single-stranded-DNA-specific exonuclease RecJ, partial [Pseudomonadota bacterium]